jgi:hypothetical protein
MFQILERKATRPEGRPGGTFIETGPDINGEVHRDTKMCAHCQRNWIVQPGSGKLRGICTCCGGDLCGQDVCMNACVTWEQQMDNIEAGLPQYHKAVKVSVPCAVPKAKSVSDGGIWLAAG